MQLSGFTSYYQPAPKIARKIGDSVLAMCTTASGFTVLTDYPKLGVAIMILGSLGKFVSNFFIEGDNNIAG